MLVEETKRDFYNLLKASNEVRFTTLSFDQMHANFIFELSN